MNCTIAWSSSSPPVRIEVSETMPDSAITAISVVPPPMSITMLPVGVSTGSPTPIAAAIGSATMYTSFAPADCGVAHGALFHLGDAARHAHDHLGAHTEEM